MPLEALLFAFDLTPSSGMFAIIAIVGIGLLAVAWFGVKFWLASTRPANIEEIQTPNLDRLNRRALEAMGNDEEEEEEEVPDALKNVSSKSDDRPS